VWATPVFVIVVFPRVVAVQIVVVDHIVGFIGASSRQLALKPLEVGLWRAVFELSRNLRLLCLSPAAAHGGTPSRNNGAAYHVGGSDL